MKIWITQDSDSFYWLHLKDGKDGAGMLLETKSGICKRMLDRAKVAEEPPDWQALANRLGETLGAVVDSDVIHGWELEDVSAAALAEWRAARKGGNSTPALPDRDALVKALIASLLPDGFFCTRVWEAWQAGTMTQADFEPIDCDRVADEILEALRARGKGEGDGC